MEEDEDDNGREQGRAPERVLGGSGGADLLAHPGRPFGAADQHASGDAVRADALPMEGRSSGVLSGIHAGEGRGRGGV